MAIDGLPSLEISREPGERVFDKAADLEGPIYVAQAL